MIVILNLIYLFASKNKHVDRKINNLSVKIIKKYRNPIRLILRIILIILYVMFALSIAFVALLLVAIIFDL